MCQITLRATLRSLRRRVIEAQHTIAEERAVILGAVLSWESRSSSAKAATLPLPLRRRPVLWRPNLCNGG